MKTNTIAVAVVVAIVAMSLAVELAEATPPKFDSPSKQALREKRKEERRQGNQLDRPSDQPAKAPKFGKYVDTSRQCKKCREFYDKWVKKYHDKSNKMTMEWLDHLPYCPCSLAEAEQLEATNGKSPTPFSKGANVTGDWHGSQHFIDRYHPGAHKCFRSGPVHKRNMNWAQQCCYSKDGKLITDGLGAGTSDYGIGGKNLGVISHYFFDVVPFQQCCEKCQSDNCDYCRFFYYGVRPADMGRNCPADSFASTANWTPSCLPHHKCYKHNGKRYIELRKGRNSGCTNSGAQAGTRNPKFPLRGKKKCRADGDCVKASENPCEGECLCGKRHVNQCRCVMEVTPVNSPDKMGEASKPYGVVCHKPVRL